MIVEALPGIPEIRPGDDLAAILGAAADLEPADVLVIAQKVVSKAEGRIVELASVTPGEDALRLAEAHGKSPQLAQLILDESAEILRADGGRIISRTRHGFVCANAGIDQSNAPAGHAILLPLDPDASARALHARLGCAVVISDSFGRPWRVGQTEVAIGCAGLDPLDDRRGTEDAHGRTLGATLIAVADELACAADLVRHKSSGQPAVRIRGYSPAGDGPAATLIRAADQDLFR